MEFTSWIFVTLFICTLFLYYRIKHKFQWIVLLIASAFFYWSTDFRFCLFILFTSFSVWICGIAMERLKRRKKTILCIAILLNIFILIALKFRNLMLTGVLDITQTQKIFLPLGISYYTLQSIGYIIDLYRGNTKCEKNYAKFFLFVAFFPQLVQGPISRYGQLAEQFYEPHCFRWNVISSSFLRISFGYFKKIVIADAVFGVIKTISSLPYIYNGGYVLVLIIAYSVTIYADFTGGMDIAIGIGEAFDLKMTENFNRPFASENFAEYWKRWHISLGAWFQDYIFYPLSVCKPMQKISKLCRKKFGKKIGRRIPVYISTLIVWSMTGMWHGLSFNFITWGIICGIILIISQELKPAYAKFHGKYPHLSKTKYYKIFCRARTFFIVGSVRLLDLYQDVYRAFANFASIFYCSDGWIDIFYNDGLLHLISLDKCVTVTFGVLLIYIVSKQKSETKTHLQRKICNSPMLTCLCLSLITIAIVLFGSYGLEYDVSAFIYNKF